MPQVQSHVPCPECAKRNHQDNPTKPCQAHLSHADLDRLLENDEVIEAVCFCCEYKWKLNAQEKARVRNQRKELRNIAAM